MPTPTEPTRVAFVCVRNAGRSQMATAFAERERERRNVDVEVVTGGTRPADRVHEVVVEAMAEVGFDLADRVPREVTPEDLQSCDYVVTMGCDAADVCPATWHGENRDWGLADPAGADLADARTIRDEIARKVGDLFDQLS